MQALSGYRIALSGNNGRTDFYRKHGASILLLNEAPGMWRRFTLLIVYLLPHSYNICSLRQHASDSEEEFRNWFQEEVAKAKQDKVAMVVVKGHTGYSQRRFIDNIEEMEFYSSDGGGGGRVRFTMISTIGTAVNDGFLLTDDWSDSISRGEIIYGDTKKAPSWLIQGVCVELKHNKAQAVIKEVHRGSCAVCV